MTAKKPRIIWIPQFSKTKELYLTMSVNGYVILRTHQRRDELTVQDAAGWWPWAMPDICKRSARQVRSVVDNPDLLERAQVDLQMAGVGESGRVLSP
jgi:hypothetical protein